MILNMQVQNKVTYLFTSAFPYCILNMDSRYFGLVLERYLSPFGLSFESGKIETGFLDGYEYGDIDCLDTRVFQTIMINEYEVNKWGNHPLVHIESMIQQGYYAVVFVDEYYLENRIVTGEAHYTHEFLVYGIDEENVYTVAMDSNQKFAKLSFSRNHFEIAMKHAPYYLNERPDCGWIKNKVVLFVRLVARESDYPVHKDIIYSKLLKYFEGSPAEESDVSLRIRGRELSYKEKVSPIKRVLYGENTKYIIFDHITSLLETAESGKEVVLDRYHRIHMYREQCRLALERILYIGDQFRVSDMVSQLENDCEKAEILRMEYLKCLQLGTDKSKLLHILEKMHVLLKQ